jgi:hypothetical protein
MTSEENKKPALLISLNLSQKKADLEDFTVG